MQRRTHLIHVVWQLVVPAECLLNLVGHIHEVGHLVLELVDLVDVEVARFGHLLQLGMRRLHGLHLRHRVLNLRRTMGNPVSGRPRGDRGGRSLRKDGSWIMVE